MKKYVLSFLLIVLGLNFTAKAQGLEKIADDTIKYVKAGTFGKPNIAKKTTKLSIGQLRVHYKLITSRASVTRNNAADVTVYLDTDLTNNDLQDLTNEFYLILMQKLGSLGIGMTPFEEIRKTEYYAERQKSQEDKKPKDYDGKAGQAWVSFSAFDGPVLVRWKPYGGTEILGYSQMKKMAKASETVGADLMTMDVVVDFASIMLNTEIKQDKGFIFYGDPYFHADYSIGGMMNIPNSYVFMMDKKNGFDQYQSALPVAERFAFAEKPYKDETKTALQTQNYFNGERHSFTPLVIPAKRLLYLNAARRVLNLYAEMLAEKMRMIRSEEKPADNNVAEDKPKDSGKTIEQVNAEAKKNNDTTPITTSEMNAAAQQAVKKGDFKLAAQYYGEIIKKYPDEPEHYFARGLVYMEKLNDKKAAANDFSKVIELKPGFNNFLAYYNRGTIYLQDKDWKKALKDFDVFIKAIPGYANAYINRAVVYYNSGKVDQAIADFTNAIQLEPRNALAYKNRAALYKVKGNTVQAQADELRAAQIERGQ